MMGLRCRRWTSIQSAFGQRFRMFIWNPAPRADQRCSNRGRCKFKNNQLNWWFLARSVVRIKSTRVTCLSFRQFQQYPHNKWCLMLPPFYSPADTRGWINVGLTLIHRVRRWIKVKPMTVDQSKANIDSMYCICWVVFMAFCFCTVSSAGSGGGDASHQYLSSIPLYLVTLISAKPLFQLIWCSTYCLQVLISKLHQFLRKFGKIFVS